MLVKTGFQVLILKFHAYLGLGTHLFSQGTLTRRQRSTLFGLRFKLPPVTSCLTTQR